MTKEETFGLQISPLTLSEMQILGASCLGMISNGKKCKAEFVPGYWDETISMAEKILTAVRAVAPAELNRQMDDIDIAMQMARADNHDFHKAGMEKFLEDGELIVENLEIVESMAAQAQQITDNTK